jgi:hypothetical protein
MVHILVARISLSHENAIVFKSGVSEDCFVYFAFFKFQKCLQRRNACGPHPQERKTRIKNDMVSVKYVLDFNLLI